MFVRFAIAVGFATFLASAPFHLAVAAEPPAGAPKVVRIPITFDPDSLDPHKTLGNSFVLDLFEGLTTWSATNSVVPGMATGWDTSPDGLTWTFHLRDALWSDGMPVTADDFVYSFRRALDPATAGPYTSVLSPIVGADAISAGREKDMTKLGVEAPDPHTLRLKLLHPTPWLPALLATQVAMPVPRQAIEQWGDKWTAAEHMVDNGPFLLKKWVPLGEIDFTRNPRFHDAASVKIDEVDRILAADPGAALKQYEVGELDVAAVPGKDLPRLTKEHPAEMLSAPVLGTGYLAVNMKGPLGADARIRQALALVIDRDVLENKIVRLGQLPAYTFLPPNMPGYATPRPDWAGLSMPERIARAKQLLADAGAPRPLKLHLLSVDLDSYKRYTGAITEMWHEALGIETEVETDEVRVALARLSHHDFEIAFNQWTADYPDPATFLDLLSSTAGELNPSGYANPGYDALLDQARTAKDPAARMKLLEASEALMLADQPIIPLSHLVTQTLVSPKLHGYEAATLGRHPARFFSIGES